MRTIHKHEIKTSFSLQMPAGWKPLLIAVQRGVPCLWVEIDTGDEEQYTHYFRVFVTGCKLPVLGSHIGTWQEGEYVFHLYQIGSAKC